MKKYLCILAGAMLLAACEQKSESVTPAASPTAAPETATTPAETTTSPSPATTP